MTNWRGLDPETRVMSRVARSGDHWLWTGSRCGLNREYGQVTLGGRRTTAHRAVWELERGPIPDGLDLLHQCGQTLCVNPAHLRPGTHAENLAEARALHGNWAPKGEAHYRAKLTAAQVATIRERYAAGERQQSLADEFGVGQVAVSLIVTGKRWA